MRSLTRELQRGKMFGPYEIKYEGRRYFGNVSLREYHIIKRGNGLYLFDVNSKTASSIPARLVAIIEKVNSPFSSLIPESEMVELRQFNLISGEEDVPSEADVSTESTLPGEAYEYPVVSIALFLAQECNMRCVYCYGDGGQYGRKGMMTKEIGFRAVDWLMVNSKGAELVRIGFFGGEPLLNFSLMKRIVPYAKEQATVKGKQVLFSITTNGSLLNDEIITFLKEERIKVFISLDGPPEYQNRQRPFKDGRGSYDTVFANVQKLRAVIPHLTARATISGDADPLRIQEAIKHAGFTTYSLVNASPVLLKTQHRAMPSEGEQTMQRMLAFYRKEAEELLATIRARKINRDCLPGFLSILSEVDFSRKHHYGCGIGKGMVGISINGDIYPCHRFVGLEESCLGNIADYQVDGLNEYWRAVVDNLPECHGCWARYLCGGGCFYNNKAHTGHMHRPEPMFCRETKALFEELIHIFCQLSQNDKEFLRQIQRIETPFRCECR